jgi:undecaprenyl diphosphate synthase
MLHPVKTKPTVPRHVAIIMDGNGRWAAARMLPRTAGHAMGVNTVRSTVESCVKAGVEVLTLFAFSSENWKRPKEEVSMLMSRFLEALDNEVAELHRNGIRLRFIGQLDRLSTALHERMASATALTAGNTRMTLVVAIAYGGRWDMVQAARSIANSVAAGELTAQGVDEELVSSRMALAGLPDPDLLIRTGGEQRISNFLLWNLAYTELYFTDVLWPDFDVAELQRAFDFFRGRQRRFGMTPAQVESR